VRDTIFFFQHGFSRTADLDTVAWPWQWYANALTYSMMPGLAAVTNKHTSNESELGTAAT